MKTNRKTQSSQETIILGSYKDHRVLLSPITLSEICFCSYLGNTHPDTVPPRPFRFGASTVSHSCIVAGKQQSFTYWSPSTCVMKQTHRHDLRVVKVTQSESWHDWVVFKFISLFASVGHRNQGLCSTSTHTRPPDTHSNPWPCHDILPKDRRPVHDYYDRSQPLNPMSSQRILISLSSYTHLTLLTLRDAQVLPTG